MVEAWSVNDIDRELKRIGEARVVSVVKYRAVLRALRARLAVPAPARPQPQDALPIVPAPAPSSKPPFDGGCEVGGYPGGRRCKEPAAWRYPADGGGYMHLCERHALSHRRSIASGIERVPATSSRAGTTGGAHGE